MTNGKKGFCKKWKSRRGESILEVLIALLISAVGMLMLANMITASFNLLEKNESRMLDYTKVEEQLAAQSGGEPLLVTDSGGTVQQSGWTDTVTLALSDGGASDVQLTDSTGTLNVICYTHYKNALIKSGGNARVLKSIPIVSYKLDG